MGYKTPLMVEDGLREMVNLAIRARRFMCDPSDREYMNQVRAQLQQALRTIQELEPALEHAERLVSGRP